MRNGERTIRVGKAKLIETLMVNREKHREAFNAAREGFQLELKEELEAKLADLAEGKAVSLYFKVSYPDNHYPDYSDVLEELEWDECDEVDLTRQEFQWYVQDRWHWREQWFTSNSAYITKAASAR